MFVKYAWEDSSDQKITVQEMTVNNIWELECGFTVYLARNVPNQDSYSSEVHWEMYECENKICSLFVI